MSITTNWTGAGDGTSWDDPDNWDNGVPNGDYDAVIDAANAASGAFNASIQLTATDQAHSVTLNDSTTSLTLTGELDTGLVDVEAGELDTSGTIAPAAIYDPINDVTNFYPPTIIDPNNSVKVLGGKFDSVTYNGTLEVQPGDTLEIANGLTVNDATGNPPGDIVLDTGATLVFDDSQTFDGANISLADQSSLLQKDLSGGTELILGNDVDIFLTSASATLGGDNIATNASIEVENATLSITASSFENGGFLNARFASTVTITAANFGNYDAGTQTLTGGHFYTFGPAAMILPDNSPVSVLQSDVYLFAYDASASAPVFETFDTSTSSDVTLQQTLTTIGQFGTLQLSTVTFTPDHAITNNGLIAMASGAVLDAASFDNEGTIEGSGIIARDIVNNGLILAENLGGPLILAGAVTGSGHIEVAPDGTLDVIGPTSQTITLLGGGPVPPHAPSAGGIGALLRLDDPASFTGTIDIEGTGTTIEIGNVNAVNTQIQGNALIVTLANGETLDFTLAGQTSDAQVVTFAPLTWRGPSAADRSGDFNVAANWNFNLVPSGAVNAILSKPGAYTVSSAQDNSVGKLIVTDAAATLDIAAGSFNAFGLVKNAGQIAIADGASLQLGGVLSDTGTIALQSTGDATKLILPANAVIKGGGTITMSDSAANAIVSSGATASLVNFDTVEGSGTVGNAGLALVNKGIINATGSTAALNLTPGALVNHGLIEATGAAGLGIAGGIINSGGTILADGAVIAITGSVTGAGGALNIAGGAILISGGVAASQTVNFETGPGLLLLGPAELFKGTVAGFAPGDAIDLLDFAFADGPSIAHISGTGAAGTTTVVTIKDGGLTAKIALLNQFAGEFSTKAADYQLVADAGAAPGTMFELAAAHT